MQKELLFLFSIFFQLLMIGNSSIGFAAFEEDQDLISLHFDHAADRDDGHSAAADKTILQSEFGIDWIKDHVVAVSGAYGINGNLFVSESDEVMNAVWNDCGGWIAAHQDRELAVNRLTNRWISTLNSGGDIWVKEGGQSDITADVLSRILVLLPEINITERIHVIQHGQLNEEWTTPSALSFTMLHADYIRIPNGKTRWRLCP